MLSARPAATVTAEFFATDEIVLANLVAREDGFQRWRVGADNDRFGDCFEPRAGGDAARKTPGDGATSRGAQWCAARWYA
jgi:hypothetical protein